VGELAALLVVAYGLVFCWRKVQGWVRG